MLETRQLLASNIFVSPPGLLTTSEGGGAAVVSVVLRKAPTDDVTIPISSSKPNEGLPDKSELVFTPANWNVVQKVRITGQSDCVRDGNKYYHLVTGPASSTDPRYDGVNAADPRLVNRDSRALVAGVIVNPTSGLKTTEAGGTASFNVHLRCAPKQPVMIPISTSDSTEGLPDVSVITFTPDNWRVNQTVTVTGQPDSIFDGDVAYSIITGAASSLDSRYAGKNSPNVQLVNRDSRDVARFDGSYEGSYTGRVTIPGLGTQRVSGPANFTVSNGVVTVTEPGDGTGVIQPGGSAGFSTTSGSLPGVRFGGTLRGILNTNNVRGSGSWSYAQGGVTGQGTWTARRV